MVTELADCTPQEKQWLAQCRLANPKAQEKIFRHYYGLVYGVCLRYLPVPVLAQEALNDCFLKLFYQLESKPVYPSHFRSWLRQLTVHTAIDAYRKEKRYSNTISLEDLPEDVGQQEELHAALNVEQMLALLNQLPDLWRLTFNLYEIEGYSHEEISQLLRIPVSSSRVYLTRAKQRLKQLLHRHSYVRTFIPVSFLRSYTFMDDPIWQQFRHSLRSYSPSGPDGAWEAFQQVQRRYQRSWRWRIVKLTGLFIIGCLCQQTQNPAQVSTGRSPIDTWPAPVRMTTRNRLSGSVDGHRRELNQLGIPDLQAGRKRDSVVLVSEAQRLMADARPAPATLVSSEKKMAVNPVSKGLVERYVGNGQLIRTLPITQRPPYTLPARQKRRRPGRYTSGDQLQMTARNRFRAQQAIAERIPAAKRRFVEETPEGIRPERLLMLVTQLRPLSFKQFNFLLKWPSVHALESVYGRPRFRYVKPFEAGISGGAQVISTAGSTKSSIGWTGGLWATVGVSHRLYVETGLNVAHPEVAMPGSGLIEADSLHRRELLQRTQHWWAISVPLLLRYQLYENRRWSWSVAAGFSSVAVFSQKEVRDFRQTTVADTTQPGKISYGQLISADPTAILVQPFRWIHVSSGIQVRTFGARRLWVEPYFSYPVRTITSTSLRSSLTGLQIRLSLFSNKLPGIKK